MAEQDKNRSKEEKGVKLNEFEKSIDISPVHASSEDDNANEGFSPNESNNNS